VVDKTLIKTLVESWGPPGHEHVIRATIQSLVDGLADEIRTDAAGNLICRMGSGGTKIMIAAHMDEIGLIVSHLDHDGFARFAAIGGLFPTTLNGNRVLFENGTVGVIGVENQFDFSQNPRLPNFFIDFSADKDGSGPVGVGDAAGMMRTLEERGDRLIAKSMDDRIGCVVAIEAMRRLAGKKTGHELYFVFTTQEEVGVRGARTAAFGINPDYGIALDVTSTGDVPKEKSPAVKLGYGAAIKVVDVMHIVPPALKALLIKRAQEAQIPYQLEILTVGSTDAAAIQVTAAGIPSAVISIPCRFVHTTSETVDVNDVQACVDLLVEVVSKPLDGLEKP
jgi:endoglucanase